MLRKLLFSFAFLLFLFGTTINAQEEDSLDTDLDTEDEHEWGWNWDWEDEFWRWEKGRPAIELSYGLGEAKHDKLTGNLAKTGLVEIKLGYVSMDKSDDCVIEFDERYAFGSKLATSLHSQKPTRNQLSSDLFRFGIGKRSGYAYNFGNLKILPYTENSAVWSKLEMKDYPVSIFPAINAEEVINDSQILDRFNKDIRFGTLSEGGLRIEVGNVISLNAGYEAAVIFPRHLFWKHLISFAIESAGTKALDNFVEEVFDSSPVATPIVNFLLKNGFSYAFYTLKKENMNWPFKTESPLTYETFKFGVTFTF